MANRVSPITIVDLENDHHTLVSPISCRGTSQLDAISVEQYTNVCDLHLLMKSNFINLDDDTDDDDDDDLKVLNFMQFKSKPSSSKPFFETGQSSKSKSESESKPVEIEKEVFFMCEICADEKPVKESFEIEGCNHFYCTDCMIQYVASKLQDNVTAIQCPIPQCRGLLEPEYCRRILPLEVFERWGNALCESVLLASEKFYCPFKDCSALLIDDGGGQIITQSECPNCRRLFCAQCKCAWHSWIDCKEYQSLNKDEREKEDIMMMQLAKSKNWKRCPKCKFYVEKSQGCFYMKCRCGNAFCYNCGATSTSNSHVCPICKH